MDNRRIYCYSCFGEFDPAHSAACPICGATERENEPWQLPAGSMLGGRYLVGLAIVQDEDGVTYSGYDPALDLPVRIREYFPRDTATRAHTLSAFVLAAPGRAEDFGEGLDSFAERARGLAHEENADDGRLRDFLALGGTEYMITATAEPSLPQRAGDTRPFTPITPAEPVVPVAEPALVYPVGEPQSTTKPIVPKKPAPPKKVPTVEPEPAEPTQAPEKAPPKKKPSGSLPLWRGISAALALLLVASIMFSLLRDPAVSAVSSVGGDAVLDAAELQERLGAVESERDSALESVEQLESELDTVRGTLSALQLSYPDAWVIINGIYNADEDLKLISAELNSADMRYLCFDFEVYSEDYTAFTGQSFSIRVYRPDGSLWQGDDSPIGATGSFEFGTDDTVYTWGWGNPEQSDYIPGDYTIVFIHNGVIIGGFLATVV